MSFGYSVGDAVLLTQLAWKTVQNARKACGEHDELTREVLSLHVVLRRLKQEVEKPGCLINKSHETYEEELEVMTDGCEKVLNVLDQVLTKYNALSEQERSGRKLWQKIRFGNGKMVDLADWRAKLTYYTSAISLFLNIVSMGSMGRVERQMNNAGGDLREIKVAVNSITAHMMSRSNRNEGSILTAYVDDDRAVWKEFRRELVEDGFSSSVIRKNKRLIKAYIKELGSRGLLDEEDPNHDAEEQYFHLDSVVEEALAPNSETRSDSEASIRPKENVESSAEPSVEGSVEASVEESVECVDSIELSESSIGESVQEVQESVKKSVEPIELSVKPSTELLVKESNLESVESVKPTLQSPIKESVEEMLESKAPLDCVAEHSPAFHLETEEKTTSDQKTKKQKRWFQKRWDEHHEEMFRILHILEQKKAEITRPTQC